MEDDSITEIPIKVYMNLTFQYYPIIEDAIKNSKTLGDIIDKFTIIYKNIQEDLKTQIVANKYNIL